MKTILLLNGPNLNLLGTRKPEVYGSETLAEVITRVEKKAAAFAVRVVHFQSNSEGALIDRIHAARNECQGIVINPGAYSHTSIAIRDALEAVELPYVEVHISDIHQRESFRHHSFMSDLAEKVIVGKGTDGYLLGLEFLVGMLNANSSEDE